jgi:hypothetical protein
VAGGGGGGGRSSSREGNWKYWYCWEGCLGRDCDVEVRDLEGRLGVEREVDAVEERVDERRVAEREGRGLLDEEVEEGREEDRT